MAYISPSTVTTGDLITAAEWNQDIVANEQAGAPDMFTTKGDLFVGTAADAGTRLGVGANGDVLMADSAEASGVKWAKHVAVAQRQGGDASDWSTAGAVNYAVGQVMVLVGAIEVTIPANQNSYALTVSFPIAFSNLPIMLCTLVAFVGELVTVAAGANSSSQGQGRAKRETSPATPLTVTIQWMAIGPA